MKLAALLLALVAAPAMAQMYKCTNERGIVQYTDSPGAGCKEVQIRASPPISGSIQPPSEDLARQEAEFRRRQVEREESVARDQQAFAQRCIQLRREHSALSTYRRIVRIDEKGEREYMDDAVRERRLGELQRELGRCP